MTKITRREVYDKPFEVVKETIENPELPEYAVIATFVNNIGSKELKCDLASYAGEFSSCQGRDQPFC